jgi:hypothetical protein
MKMPVPDAGQSFLLTPSIQHLNLFWQVAAMAWRESVPVSGKIGRRTKEKRQTTLAIACLLSLLSHTF